MKKKKRITYLVLFAVAAAIVLATVFFELGSHGRGAVQVIQYLSDGLFTMAVLYIGCSLLMFIQEAGNFYGIQYLFHTLVRLFSFSKKRSEDKKDYFTYCSEKKEQREAEGDLPLKKCMLFFGLGCLAVSVILVLIYYRMA